MGCEVGEAVGSRNIGDAALSGEWVVERRRGIGILNIGSNRIGVNQGDDATELCGGREVGIRANGRNRHGKGVGVLLGLDELLGDGNDLSIISEFGDNSVGELELVIQS